MALILDGHNLLFALARFGDRTEADAIEDARVELLQRLLRCRRHTAETITLVFDNRRLTGGARPQESIPGIRVLYPHPPRTADDEIRRLVEASTAPQHLRVVTSDRQLARACAAHGAIVVDAQAFLRELARQAEAAAGDEEENRLKTEAPSREEILDWLKVFEEPDTQDPRPRRPK